MYIALAVFFCIVLSAFYGKVMRNLSEQGLHPAPWVPYALSGLGASLLLAAMFKRYYIDSRAPPKFMKTWLGKDAMV